MDKMNENNKVTVMGEIAVSPLRFIPLTHGGELL